MKRRPSMHYLSRLLFAVAPLLIVLSACLQVLLPTDSDKGWLLYAARQLLLGRTLDKDIIEVNPPLVVWFYLIPSWLSLHIKGLRDYEALGLVGLAFCSLSAGVSYRLIKSHRAFAADAAFQFKFLLSVALVFVYYTMQVFFFDREHIFFVLTFPYMLRFMPSLAAKPFSLRLRLLIGLMAALGFCIKPHTVIVFALLQLYVLIRARSLRVLASVENAVIFAGGFLYLMAVARFVPQYLSLIVPMAAATYGQFGDKHSGSLYLPIFALGVFLIFAHYRPRHKTPYRADVFYFAGVTLAFLAYALANNGWGYTYNPLFCMLVFTAAWMLWEYEWLLKEYTAQQIDVTQILYGLRGCGLVLVANAGYIFVYTIIMYVNLDNIRSPCTDRAACWNHSPFPDYLQQNHISSFGTMTFDFNNWVLLMRMTDAHWETRFNHLWMLPKLLKAAPEYVKAHEDIVRYVGISLAEDMGNRKPEIMIVDHSPALMGENFHFDLVEFLSDVPEFKQAFAQYGYDKTFDSCDKTGSSAQPAGVCRYDVFRRMPDVKR